MYLVCMYICRDSAIQTIYWLQVEFGKIKEESVGLLNIINGSVDDIRNDNDLYKKETYSDANEKKGKVQFSFKAKRDSTFYPKIKWSWQGRLQSKDDQNSYSKSPLNSRMCSGKPLETNFWKCPINKTQILSSQICDGTIDCCAKEDGGTCDENDTADSDDENKDLCTGGNYHLILMAVGIYVFLGIMAYFGKFNHIHQMFKYLIKLTF